MKLIGKKSLISINLNKQSYYPDRLYILFKDNKKQET